jgi:excisionase family DNA binding protein
MTGSDTYLTAAEVATHMRVTAATVRNWVHRGQLPAVKVGLGRGEWKVTADDLEAFLRAHTSSSAVNTATIARSPF